jgi:integrase
VSFENGGDAKRIFNTLRQKANATVDAAAAACPIEWIVASGITKGRVFRAVARGGKIWGSGISENVVWYVVRSCCQRAGLEHIAPHDLRRTCAKLCHTNGGELEQIQFLLGHASVLTTERYLGCKQNLGHPVNDPLRP